MIWEKAVGWNGERSESSEESFVDKKMVKETFINQDILNENFESRETNCGDAGGDEGREKIVECIDGVENREENGECTDSVESQENTGESADSHDEKEEEPSIEERLETASWEEMNKLKSWLFKENVRIISAAKELEQMQGQFEQEKEQFQEEMKALNRKMSAERQRLKDDSLFFEKKMEILKGGFTELDMDRRRLAKEWAKLEAQKEVLQQQPVYGSVQDVSDLFRGVKNPLALKKRYKDLIKIFHPDNVAGDKEMIQKINKEYENLKHEYDIGKWA